jgi:hypothetical protein
MVSEGTLRRMAVYGVKQPNAVAIGLLGSHVVNSVVNLPPLQFWEITNVNKKNIKNNLIRQRLLRPNEVVDNARLYQILTSKNAKNIANKYRRIQSNRKTK